MTMSKHFFISSLGITVVTLVLMSCQHDPILVEQPPTDGTDSTAVSGNTCDADSIYFAKDVLPILATNCALSGCHDAQSHEDGVALIDYNRTISTGKVRAFRPSNSDLYEVLLENGEDRMPPAPRAPLTSAQIAIIKKWIEQGAQNLTCNTDAGGCETANVKFSAYVQPMIVSRCQGCHSSASTGGGIFLRNYTEIKATALSGTLYGAVSHAAGYSAMPKVGARLSACELAKVKAWIDAGAQQN
jgi:uncharacterized membrane protein